MKIGGRGRSGLLIKRQASMSPGQSLLRFSATRAILGIDNEAIVAEKLWESSTQCGETAYFLSAAICFAISASRRGFSSAKTVSTMLERASPPAGCCDDVASEAAVLELSVASCEAGSLCTCADSTIAVADCASASVVCWFTTESRMRSHWFEEAAASELGAASGNSGLDANASTGADDAEADAAAANAAPADSASGTVSFDFSSEMTLAEISDGAATPEVSTGLDGSSVVESETGGSLVAGSSAAWACRISSSSEREASSAVVSTFSATQRGPEGTADAGSASVGAFCFALALSMLACSIYVIESDTAVSDAAGVATGS